MDGECKVPPSHGGHTMAGSGQDPCCSATAHTFHPDLAKSQHPNAPMSGSEPWSFSMGAVKA